MLMKIIQMAIPVYPQVIGLERGGPDKVWERIVLVVEAAIKGRQRSINV